jgi:hypothetical protein
MLRKEDAGAGRTFEMAQRNITNRHQDSSMRSGKSISQINTFVPRNKHKLCRNSSWSRAPRGFCSFQLYVPRPERIQSSEVAVHAPERVSIYGPSRKWPSGRWPSGVRGGPQVRTVQ